MSSILVLGGAGYIGSHTAVSYTHLSRYYQRKAPGTADDPGRSQGDLLR